MSLRVARSMGGGLMSTKIEARCWCGHREAAHREGYCLACARLEARWGCNFTPRHLYRQGVIPGCLRMYVLLMGKLLT